MNFEEVVGWGNDAWSSDVTGVAVDSKDRVYVLRRGDDPVTVLSRDGSILARWGTGHLSDRPHLIWISDDDKIYVADDGGHKICVFGLTGNLIRTIGNGVPAETGYDQGATSSEIALGGMPGGPPFNRPTKAVASRSGELFVSDGYRNCRVHRFSADGRLLQSWGGTGAAAGCFVIPHSIAIDSKGRILVCDRENDRIQVFTPEGELLEVWGDVQRPTDVAFDRHGYMYVTELSRGPHDLKSWRLGPAKEELPGRVTIWSPERSVVARLGSPRVQFLAPHSIAIDSKGAVYVVEVPQSFMAYTGRPHQPHRCLHKFEARNESGLHSQRTS